ncbi:MAG: polyisoprenoid-binding protein [Saprospiraceae bacterium]|nr:MAG: polyisoprenoid-binding protein [Saprospiraceae bacterium]
MKSIFRLTFGLAIAAALFSFTLLLTPPKHWSVDKAHSAITFNVTHLFTPVEGRFQKFEDNFFFDPENLQESKASFTIDVASVNTQETKRDNHLQSADWFDAQKFPSIKFASTRFEKKGDNSYVAYGKLTIKDVTKDVALPFKVLGIADHPMMKGAKAMSIQSEIALNRNDYGVGAGSWAGTMVVGDNVNVKIVLEATSM